MATEVVIPMLGITVEKGKIADLLVVAGHPQIDLNALRNVRLVIHGGVPIRNELPKAGDHPPRRARRRAGLPAAPPLG